MWRTADDARPNPPLHVGQLPDCISLLSKLNWFVNMRHKHHPLVHLFSKALPQRCQFRNFREICAQYCVQRPIRTTIRALVMASLAGWYPHCDPVPPSASSEMTAWFRSPTDSPAWCADNGLLVFYVLKEYLIYAVHFDPALHQVVCDYYEWSAFAADTVATMNEVRRHLHSVESGTSVEGVRPRIPELNRLLLRHHTRNTKGLFKLTAATPLGAWAAALQRGWTKRAKAGLPTPTGVSLSRFVTALFAALHEHQTSDLGSPAVALRVAALLGADATDQRKMRGHLVDGGRGCAAPAVSATVESLVLRLAVLQSVTVQTLPSHFYEHQYNALCSRHSLDPLQPQNVETLGTFYLCLVCETFKGFVVGGGTVNKNLFAFGHSKMAYDDATGQVFCSRHKNERSQGPHPKLKQRGQVLQSLGLANLCCETTRCVPVRLLGQVCLCFGKQYALCCRCGCPAVFEAAAVREGALFTCGACSVAAIAATQQCCYCGTLKRNAQRGWSRVSTLGGAGNCVRAWLCPRHSLPRRTQNDDRVWVADLLFRRIRDRVQRSIG